MDDMSDLEQRMWESYRGPSQHLYDILRAQGMSAELAYRVAVAEDRSRAMDAILYKATDEEIAAQITYLGNQFTDAIYRLMGKEPPKRRGE